jgi:hypothetical protein
VVWHRAKVADVLKPAGHANDHGTAIQLAQLQCLRSAHRRRAPLLTAPKRLSRHRQGQAGYKGTTDARRTTHEWKNRGKTRTWAKHALFRCTAGQLYRSSPASVPGPPANAARCWRCCDPRSDTHSYSTVPLVVPAIRWRGTGSPFSGEKQPGGRSAVQSSDSCPADPIAKLRNFLPPALHSRRTDHPARKAEHRSNRNSGLSTPRCRAPATMCMHHICNKQHNNTAPLFVCCNLCNAHVPQALLLASVPCHNGNAFVLSQALPFCSTSSRHSGNDTPPANVSWLGLRAPS